MADPFFRPRRIAFAGSSRALSPIEAAFCNALGRYLGLHTNDTLITAGFKKAPMSKGFAGDWHFIEGVRAAIPDPARLRARVQTLRYAKDMFTQSGRSKVGRFSEGDVVQVDHPINEVRRMAMTDRADAVIAVKGSAGGGTAQIALFALATGTPLLPVVCFGGGVQQLWDKNRAAFCTALGLDEPTARRWESKPTCVETAMERASEMAQHFHRSLAKTCFVVTPFAQAQKPVYDDIIAPAVEGLGDKVWRLDVLGLAGDVLRQIAEGIRAADYVIAVLDDLRPNVLYEIGMAHALGKPVILMNTKGAIGDAAPFDIGHHQRLEFDAPDPDVAARLQKMIHDLRLNAFP